MIPLAIQQSKPTHSFCWQPQTRLVSLFQWKCGWNMLKTRQGLAVCLTETGWYRVFCTLPYFSIISPLSSVFLWAPIPFSWSKHKLIPRWVSFPFFRLFSRTVVHLSPLFSFDFSKLGAASLPDGFQAQPHTHCAFLTAHSLLPAPGILPSASPDAKALFVWAAEVGLEVWRTRSVPSFVFGSLAAASFPEKTGKGTVQGIVLRTGS